MEQKREAQVRNNDEYDDLKELVKTLSNRLRNIKVLIENQPRPANWEQQVVDEIDIMTAVREGIINDAIDNLGKATQVYNEVYKRNQGPTPETAALALTAANALRTLKDLRPTPEEFDVLIEFWEGAAEEDLTHQPHTLLGT